MNRAPSFVGIIAACIALLVGLLLLGQAWQNTVATALKSVGE